MAKRKEIKWRRTGRRILEGRQDGMEFRIYEDVNRGKETEARYTVSEYDTKELGRSINTAGHRTFTLEGAKEFCQQIAAGEVDLEAMQAEFDAEDAAKEQRAIREAVKAAKAFRAKLEAAGLSYLDLLELEALRANIGDLAHNMLLGYERGEGWPDGTR